MILLLAGCQQDDASIADDDDPYLITQDRAIDPVLQMNSLRSSKEVTSRSPVATSAFSYYDDSEKPTAHVVNITDDEYQGWVMVSGDTRVDPVLAYGTEGHRTLEDGKLGGVQEHLMASEGAVVDARAANNPSAVVHDLDMVASMMCIGPPGDCPPTGGGGGGGGCNFVNRIVGPLMDTEWGQNCPYNLRITDNSCTNSCNLPNPRVGCVPLAIAQIVNFHEFPFGFQYANMLPRYRSWSNQDRQVASQSGNVADITAAVGFAISANYGCDQTWAVPWKIDDTFEDLGYSSDGTRDNYNHHIVEDELDLGFPVIVEGRESTISNWHVWAVDGYRRVQTSNCTSYWYQHMNWGWNGTSNGFYGIGVWQPNERDADYDTHNKMVTGIRP